MSQQYNIVTINYLLSKNATIDFNNEWKEWNFYVGKMDEKIKKPFYG